MKQALDSSKSHKAFLSFRLQDYTNKYLIPPQVFFYDSSQNNFVKLKSFSKVLEELDIKEVKHESALKIFDDSKLLSRPTNQPTNKLLSRPTNSCFFNNYFDVGLLAWEVNIDINTAWKMSVFGLILIHIFPYSNWIRRDTPHLSVFSPKAGKCGLEQLRIRALFTLCKPV